MDDVICLNTTGLVWRESHRKDGFVKVSIEMQRFLEKRHELTAFHKENVVS